ncbi:peptidoglycan DD-metalloendopeptidase family protein [Aquibium sp. A9E412]|uniref:peptidoglycan DD-metalloendopeptidase family protein n=1 Tax=Aquibium sp. A9E412 TaxID=2976767 RepID=UPI0025B06EEA|nr:peptidoglycan DD-metalloendopeptidase family protein [Aquibium sp. A9E412]MDN2567356.1 peptidoglycan DD-metalloendopeptidase family protein [Aquibium sp. A9E412]
MNEVRRSPVFGKRKEPHTVIIARGDHIRHFTVRPWLAALVGSALCAIAIGYLGATSYLVLRDDLIGAASAHQARTHQAYEDRIAALRAQVDRITSRQLLDQRLMEERVGELMERQAQLARRQGRLAPVLERVRGETPPVPTPRPQIRADAAAAEAAEPTASPRAGTPPAALSAYAATAQASVPWPLRSGHAPSAADEADRLFVAINRSLSSIESEQLARIETLSQNADTAADTIAGALEQAGLSVEIEAKDGTGRGGPLLALGRDLPFESRVQELDETLARLETLKSEARRLPIAHPVPGAALTSRFGVRRDPLIGTPAHHSGLDFRAATGHPVRAAGAGTVVTAGWNGGYGRMVEIRHADGLTTRYAHMSKITVRKGQEVGPGTVIGKVGSSGRSTGPHLHYEVRRSGEAVDPAPYIRAGRKIAGLI